MKRKGKKNKTFSNSKLNKILKESALLEHKRIHSFSNRNSNTRKKIKIIKLPMNHVRCPICYRRHPTKKKYCIKEQSIDTNKLDPWHKQINEWRKEHGLNHSMLDVVPENGKILPQQVIQSLYKEPGG